MISFYEFFAGGGMVRMGLGPRWSCLFANDFDQKKARVYRRNWGGDVSGHKRRPRGGGFRPSRLRRFSMGILPLSGFITWPVAGLAWRGIGPARSGPSSPSWKR